MPDAARSAPAKRPRTPGTSIVSDTEVKRISPAFTRLAAGTLCTLTVLAVLAFAVTTRYLLHARTSESVARTAEACAAALEPEADGDLMPSIDRLLSRNTSLRAVGMLDAAGRLKALVPGDDAYAKAAGLTLTADAAPVSTGVAALAADKTLWGAVVPMATPGEPTARRVVLLFALDGFRSTWLLSVLVFAGVACVLNLCGLGALRRWFDACFVKPLIDFQRIEPLDGQGRDVMPVYRTHGWYEFERVAQAFIHLRRGLAESYGRKLRTEQAAERKIEDHKHGMARRLRRAQDQAVTDPLTGLRNRTFLTDQLDKIHKEAADQGQDLSIVMIDVDEFKYHNDVHGHCAGDEVLSFIGDLLQGAVRPSDFAVRYGGDEFLLILPGASAEQAAGIAQRVVQLFSQYAASLRVPNKMSLSAGVASVKRGNSESGQQLMSAADHALYAAKRGGKHCVRIDAAEEEAPTARVG